MITHVLDTNIVSRYLTGIPHFVQLVEESIGIEKVCISVITKIELLNWLSNYRGITTSERNVLKKAINSLPIKHINEKVSRLANDYIAKNINSKPGDTLIGLTAQYYNLVMVTINEKDFSNFNLIIIRAKP